MRLIPSVRVINLVKKSRLKPKVELKGRKSNRRPTSPEGPLIEDVEDEELPAGMNMTDSWIEELKVSETLGEWSELVWKPVFKARHLQGAWIDIAGADQPVAVSFGQVHP